MVSRRGFLGSTFAVAALAASASSAALATSTGSAPAGHRRRSEPAPGPENRSNSAAGDALLAFIVDRSLPFAAAFTTLVPRYGLPLRTIDSDPGGLWMREVEPAWRGGAAALAGFTSGPTLFCLQVLARAYGFDVVYRTEHARAAGGPLVHRHDGVQLTSGTHRLTFPANGSLVDSDGAPVGSERSARARPCGAASWIEDAVEQAARWHDGVARPATPIDPVAAPAGGVVTPISAVAGRTGAVAPPIAPIGAPGATEATCAIGFSWLIATRRPACRTHPRP